jgi:hypothetical protein
MLRSFILPSKYTSVSDLPIPKNLNVKLIEVPEKEVCATLGIYVQLSDLRATLGNCVQLQGFKLSLLLICIRGY